MVVDLPMIAVAAAERESLQRDAAGAAGTAGTAEVVAAEGSAAGNAKGVADTVAGVVEVVVEVVVVVVVELGEAECLQRGPRHWKPSRHRQKTCLHRHQLNPMDSL